jgi:hypothetical protein
VAAVQLVLGLLAAGVRAVSDAEFARQLVAATNSSGMALEVSSPLQRACLLLLCTKSGKACFVPRHSWHMLAVKPRWRP